MTTSTGRRGRGRPPSFDRDAVIDSAIAAFMTHGFDGTTLPELEAATGVDRSTLYNSFGGKSGLYDLATERYLDRAEQGLFAPLHHGTDDGLADVLEVLGRLRMGLTAATVPGCLIVNDIAAGSAPEAAARYRELLEGGLHLALGRAAAAGDIEADTVDDRARLLATVIVGINLVSKQTADPVVVAQQVDAAVAEVTAWRRPVG